MPAINLVPPELKPKRSILALANLLKRTAIVGFSIFLTSLFVSVGGFLLVSNQLNRSFSHQENLKNSIEALEETEKRLVLVQDRLERANTVLAAATASEEIRVLENAVQTLPAGVSFLKAELTPSKAQFTISAATSSALSQFFASLLASGTFNRIELVSFTYSGELGYKAELALTK